MDYSFRSIIWSQAKFRPSTQNSLFRVSKTAKVQKGVLTGIVLMIHQNLEKFGMKLITCSSRLVTMKRARSIHTPMHNVAITKDNSKSLKSAYRWPRVRTPPVRETRTSWNPLGGSSWLRNQRSSSAKLPNCPRMRSSRLAMLKKVSKVSDISGYGGFATNWLYQNSFLALRNQSPTLPILESDEKYVNNQTISESGTCPQKLALSETPTREILEAAQEAITANPLPASASSMSQKHPLTKDLKFRR